MTLAKYNAAGELLQDEARFAPASVVCSAERPATMLVGISSEAVMDFTAKAFDPFGYFDLNTDRFQPKIAGYYDVAFLVTCGAGTGTQEAARIYRNGVLYRDGVTVNAAYSTEIVVTAVVYLNGSTDYLEFRVVNYDGAANRTFTGYVSMALVAASVGVAPEPWHVVGAAGEPAFGTGWSVHTYPAKFMKDPHGFVHLAGRVQSSGSQVVVFTLPVGYRPAADAGPGYALAGYWSANRQLANMQIFGSDGTVRIFGGNDAIQATSYTSLETVTFRAEG